MQQRKIFSKMNSIIGEGPDKKSYLGEDDFVEVRYRNIKLSYHVKNKLIDLAKLLGTVRRITEKLHTSLDIPPGPMEIEIFRDRNEWIGKHTHISEKDVPSWVQGDSGRVIRIVMADDGTTTFEKLQLMVTHECVHLALKNAFGEKLPAWLDEGLALHFSQELPGNYTETLYGALEGDAILPFELLEGSFTRFDRNVKDLAYAQSCTMVRYLMARYGREIVRDLLVACSRNESPEHVLRGYGLNFYLLEKEWQSDLLNRR